MRVVQENVGGHKHRVIEEPGARALRAPFLGLVFELRHPRELPEPGYAIQEPGKLRVPRDPALPKDDGLLRVYAGGQVYSGDLPDLPP